jgi:WD40 repeat protein
LSRAQYVARDHVELVVAPNALSFSLDGTKIYAGFNNRLNIFDTSVPGSTCDSVLLTPSKRSKKGLKGLVSDISFNPDNSRMFAVGTFAGNVGLFDERNNDLLEVRQVKGGGISQVRLSSYLQRFHVCTCILKV